MHHPRQPFPNPTPAIRRSLIIASTIACALLACTGQATAAAEPDPASINPPPGSVLIPGRWVHDGTRQVWQDAYWQAPPPVHAPQATTQVYVEGRWATAPDGSWQWIPAHYEAQPAPVVVYSPPPAPVIVHSYPPPVVVHSCPTPVVVHAPRAPACQTHTVIVAPCPPVHVHRHPVIVAPACPPVRSTCHAGLSISIGLLGRICR